MDIFGSEIIEVNGKQVKLPRASICRTIHKSISCITVSKSGAYAHCIRPHITENCYGCGETLQIIKHSIWHNIFCFGKSYTFNNDAHYPTIFQVYLNTRLKLKIEDHLMNLFIEHVRNYAFARINYYCHPNLVAAANWAAEGVIEMKSTQRYIVDPSRSEKGQWLSV